jgi:hypothetical protein
VIELVTTSLQTNALRRFTDVEGLVYFSAFERTSRSGRLKSLLITHVSDSSL